MNRQHVLDLLPLWVEGDLPAGEARIVDRHLAGCGACRAQAEALRASQAWLKEAPGAPFAEADYARLRGEVMARLRQEPRKPRRFLLRAALAAAALFAIAGLLRFRRPPALPTPPAVAKALPPPLPPRPARPLRPRHRPQAPPRTFPALARIELQTANPHIRIIWLAPQTAPAGPSTPL